MTYYNLTGSVDLRVIGNTYLQSQDVNVTRISVCRLVQNGTVEPLWISGRKYFSKNRFSFPGIISKSDSNGFSILIHPSSQELYRIGNGRGLGWFMFGSFLAHNTKNALLPREDPRKTQRKGLF